MLAGSGWELGTLMFDVTLKTQCGNNARLARWAWRVPVLWASLLVLLALTGAGWAAGADSDVHNPATSVAPSSVASIGAVRTGLPFAVADFDGDLRPDLASVQSGVNQSGSTNYSIQLRLSAAGRQSIQLVAPTGGLFIEARDVNGDNAVDLVLTTAWFRQPVAIYLNDGHGGFSRASPNAFPGAFSGSKTNWTSTETFAADTVGVPPQSGAGICAAEPDSLHDRSPERLIAPSSAGFATHPFLVSQPGRAPPSEVSYL